MALNWILVIPIVMALATSQAAASLDAGRVGVQAPASKKTAGDKAAYLAGFDWHDDEIGISIDALTSTRDLKGQWNRVEIRGRVFTAERHYTHVTVKFGVYEGGHKTGELTGEIQADFKPRTGFSFRASQLGIPLAGKALTWKVEQVICLVEGGVEAHYFGPARASDAAMTELNANLDGLEIYADEFGILADAGPFFSAVGDQYLIDIQGKAIAFNYDCASVSMRFSITSGGVTVADAAVSTTDLAKTTFWRFRIRQTIPAAKVTGTLAYQVEEISCKDRRSRSIIRYVKP